MKNKKITAPQKLFLTEGEILLRAIDSDDYCIAYPTPDGVWEDYMGDKKDIRVAVYELVGFATMNTKLNVTMEKK